MRGYVKGGSMKVGVPRNNRPSGHQAGGTHPTRMLSCFSRFFSLDFLGSSLS